MHVLLLDAKDEINVPIALSAFRDKLLDGIGDCTYKASTLTQRSG